MAAAFGSLAAQAGLPDSLALALSTLVYAGAAQFAGLHGIISGSGVGVLILTMLMINLRHVPMSLSTPETSYRFNLRHRLGLAAWLTDESFALGHAHPGRSLPYYVGLYVVCWISWVGGTALGLVFGDYIPTEWLTFALPALFISLAVDAFRGVSPRRLPLILVAGVAILLLARLAGPLALPLAIAALLPTLHLLTKNSRGGIS